MGRGVDYATVDRVAGPIVTITIHRSGGETAGPYRCHFLQGPGAVTGLGDYAPVPHTHIEAPPLAAGDRVLVAYIADDLDRPVVLGRIAT